MEIGDAFPNNGGIALRSILIPGDVHTRTYKFHNDVDGTDNPFDEQIVKSGEILLEPASPKGQDNKVFRGWKYRDGKTGEWNKGDDIQLPKTIEWTDKPGDPVNEDIHLVPYFESRYTITYIVEGQVWRVDQFDEGKIQIGPGAPEPADKNSLEYKRWDGLDFDAKVDEVTFPSPHIRNGKEYFAYWMEKDKYDELNEQVLKPKGKKLEEDSVYPDDYGPATLRGKSIRYLPTETVVGGKKALRVNEFERADWKLYLRKIKQTPDQLGEDKNITLVAVTGLKTEIFFDSQGGSAVRPLYIRHEQSINEGSRDYFEDFSGFDSYPQPTRQGYKFVGWSTEPGIIADKNEDYSDVIKREADSSGREKIIVNTGKYPKFKLKSWEDKVESQVVLYAIWQPVETSYSISLWLEDTNQWDESKTQPPFQIEDSKKLTYSYYKFVKPVDVDPTTKLVKRIPGDGAPPPVFSGEKIDVAALKKFLAETPIPADQRTAGAVEGNYLDDTESQLGLKYSDVYELVTDFDDASGNSGLYEPVKGDGTTDLQIKLRRKPHEYSVRYRQYMESDANGNPRSYADASKGDKILTFSIPHGYNDRKLLTYIRNYIGDPGIDGSHYPDYFRRFTDGTNNISRLVGHTYARYAIRPDASGVDQNIPKGFTYNYEDPQPGEEPEEAPGLKINGYQEIRKPTTIYISPFTNDFGVNTYGTLYIENESGHPNLDILNDYMNLEINKEGQVVHKGSRKPLRDGYIMDYPGTWEFKDSTVKIPGFDRKTTNPPYLGYPELTSYDWYGRPIYRYHAPVQVRDLRISDPAKQLKTVSFAFVYYVRKSYDLNFVPQAGVPGQHPDFKGARKFEDPIYIAPGQPGSDGALNQKLKDYQVEVKDAAGNVTQKATIVNRDGVRYEFTGWYLSPEARPETKVDLNKLGQDKMPSHDMTLYGGWRPMDVLVRVFLNDKKQKVTGVFKEYDSVNGEDDGVAGVDYYDIWVPYGTKVKEANPATHERDPAQPKAVGHGGNPDKAKNFKWWFWVPRPKKIENGKWTGEGDGYEEPYVFDYDITSPRKLFPRWFYHNVKIVYDANTGTNPPVDDLTYSFNSQANLRERGEMTAPEGKVFIGWSLSPDPIDPNTGRPKTESNGKVLPINKVYGENDLLSLTDKDVPTIKEKKDPVSNETSYYEVTMYAVWDKKPDPTDLTYHENGMKGGDQKVVVDTITKGTQTLPIPVNTRIKILAFNDEKITFRNDEYTSPKGYRVWSSNGEAGKLDNGKLYIANQEVLLDNVRKETENQLYARYSAPIVEKTADKKFFQEAGEVINYTVKITNKGNISWDKNQVKLVDSLVEASKSRSQPISPTLGDPNNNDILDAGEIWTYTYQYTATDSDVGNEVIKNTAHAEITDIAGDPDKSIKTDEAKVDVKLATRVNVDKKWTGQGRKPQTLHLVLLKGDRPINSYSATAAEISAESFKHKFTTDHENKPLPLNDENGQRIANYRIVEITDKLLPSNLYSSNNPANELKEVQENNITAGMSKEVADPVLIEVKDESGKLKEKSWNVEVTNHLLKLPNTGASRRIYNGLIGVVCLGLGAALYFVKKRKME